MRFRALYLALAVGLLAACDVNINQPVRTDTLEVVKKDTVRDTVRKTDTVKKTDTIIPANTGGWDVLSYVENIQSAYALLGTRTGGAFAPMSPDDFIVAEPFGAVRLAATADTAYIAIATGRFHFTQQFGADSVLWTLTGNLGVSSIDTTKFKVGPIRAVHRLTMFDLDLGEIGTVSEEHPVEVLGNDFRYRKWLSAKDAYGTIAWVVIYRPVTFKKTVEFRVVSDGFRSVLGQGAEAEESNISTPSARISVYPLVPALRAAGSGTEPKKFTDLIREQPWGRN